MHLWKIPGTFSVYFMCVDLLLNREDWEIFLLPVDERKCRECGKSGTCEQILFTLINVLINVQLWAMCAIVLTRFRQDERWLSSMTVVISLTRIHARTHIRAARSFEHANLVLYELYRLESIVVISVKLDYSRDNAIKKKVSACREE